MTDVQLSDASMKQLEQEVKERRKMIGIISKTYCTKCYKLDAVYVSSSVMDGSTECEECYINRRATELSRTIENIKKVRLENVRKYFTTKRLARDQEDT